MASKKRLLATDLDGTFLASDGRVTTANKAALHATRESDLDVIFVTGRPARWLRGVADAAQHYNLIIGANGGFIADMQRMEVIQSTAADSTALELVVEKILHKYPDANFAIERSYVGMPIASSTGLEYKEMNVSELSEFEFAVTPGYETRWRINQTIPIAPIDELITQTSITKLLIKPPSAEGWNSDTWLAEIQPLVGNLLQTTHASQDVVLAEVSAQGVTKATALEKVAANLGIDATKVVAVGDMPNDVPMLQWAGEAWAVANAHDEVLAVTNNRLPHHDDSPVAQLIHDLLSRN